MTRANPVADRRRRATLLAVGGAHLAAAIWLLRVAPPVPAVVTPAIALLAFPAPVAAPERPPAPAPVLETPAVAPLIEITAPVAPLLLALVPPPASVPGSAIGACAPLEQVQGALQAAPAVRAAISRVPRADRSVAEAIVVWNSEWQRIAADDAAPLALVRQTVVQALERLPADCLAAPLAGPRLILLDGGPRAVVLVFGSGNWRWIDLGSAR